MSKETKPYLSVIIPSYNETHNLSRDVLAEVFHFLQRKNFSWELILSDDGSTDNTVRQLKTFASQSSHIKVLENPHRGKGPTVKQGMLAAEGLVRLFTDFDQSTPIYEVDTLLPFTNQGFEIVIGSRESPGAKRNDEPVYRHIMGRGFNILVQHLAVPGVLDSQCGFKIFSAQAARDVFRYLYVYGGKRERKDPFTGAFDVEALYLANKFGYAIKEVPVKWQHYRTKNVDPVKDSLRMLLDIIKIRLADAGGHYPANP